MNTYTITKAMIESTVDHGIKSMEEDPKRSMRRLCDLGRQFSKSRCQDYLFGIIQELLENEDSSYYDLVANALKNTDHGTIRDFGVAFGYTSWTYGARMLRSFEKKTGHAAPLTLMLRFQPDLAGGLSISDIDNIIQQGTAIGIFSYFIREVGGSSDSYEIINLFRKYPDCGFAYFRSSGRLTAAQIQMMKLCKNLLTLLPCEDSETALTAPFLRDNKILFGISALYNSAYSTEQVSEALRNVIPSEATFFIPIADDSVPESEIQKFTDLCYKSRLEQNYPVFVMDYYGDTAALFGRFLNHKYLLEIGEDKRIIRPADSSIKVLPTDIPLGDALQKIMPAIDTTDISEK